MVIQDVPVQDKEVVLAIFGASIGSTSLLLVFQGLLISAYQGVLQVGGRTPKTRDTYRLSGKFVLFVLILSLATTFTALSWLLGAEVYGLVVGLFVAVMILIWALAAFVLFRLIP